MSIFKTKSCTESEIVEGCRSASPKAQKVLFDKYSAKLYAICRRYLPDTMEAEDALITAIAKGLQSIDNYNGGSLEGWLRKITVNECLMRIRKLKTILPDADVAEQSGLETEPPDHLEFEELLDLLNRLPDGCRVVFNLFVVEGYTHTEIAEMLDISVGTSKSQLSKAKAMLRQIIETEYKLTHTA